MAIVTTTRGYPTPDRAERVSIPAHLSQLATTIDRDVASVEKTARDALTSAQSTLSTSISTEATNRTNADTALGKRVDQVITDRTAAETALGSRIDQETTDRQAGDTALGDRIDAEAATRDTADTSLGERLSRVEDAAGFGQGSANDATVAALVASSSSQVTGELVKRYAPLGEADTRSQADAKLQSDLDAAKTRIKTLEDFIASGAYGGTQLTATLSNFTTYGQPIAQPMAGGGRAINWSGTLSRTNSSYSIPAGTWTTIGTLASSIRPKAGTEGNGLGQIDGKAMTVKIGSDGLLQVWSIAAVTMNIGTGLNFSVNWIAA